MSLHCFCKDIAVPMNLIVDYHQAKTSIEVKILCGKVGKTPKILENSTPWANRAEMYIGLLKYAVCKDIRAFHSPILL